MESLFDNGKPPPTSVLSLRLGAWPGPVRFAELMLSLSVLHNRILALRKLKEAVTKGQLLHPASTLPEDEMLEVRRLPADGQPLELLVFPAVARTFAALLAEVARAAPEDVPYRNLIVLFKDELEILNKRRYREDEIRRLLKLDTLKACLCGAAVVLTENAEGE